MSFMNPFTGLTELIEHGQFLASQTMPRRGSTATSRTSVGFTIVELLIVIVVIGILAAIVIVAFNGVQTRASNSAKFSELKSFAKLFELYKIENGAYPQQSLTSGRYCLGTGFPGAGPSSLPTCYLTGYTGAYNTTYSHLENDPTAISIRDDLNTVGTVPSPVVTHIVGSVMGPVAMYAASYIDLITIIKAETVNDCPSGTANSWPSTQADLETYGYRLECRIRLTK